MNEIQGVSPAGTSRPYRSLTEALRGQRIAPENHDFITEIVEAIGVSSLIDRGRYIEAIRVGEGAALHIGRTYTNGFSEQEQVVVGKAVLRLQPSEGRAPYFYVVHPSEFLPAASSKKTTDRVPRVAKPIERSYGVCEVCFMERNAAGGCSCIE